MTIILCPTRGGEGSYPNQDKAINLSKDRQARLIFMYVYNVRFLNSITSPLLTDIEEELEELGEFLLVMAQERAEKQGVEAEAVIRHGSFRAALKEVIREYGVDVITFGAATGPEGYTDAGKTGRTLPGCRSWS